MDAQRVICISYECCVAIAEAGVRLFDEGVSAKDLPSEAGILFKATLFKYNILNGSDVVEKVSLLPHASVIELKLRGVDSILISLFRYNADGSKLASIGILSREEKN